MKHLQKYRHLSPKKNKVLQTLLIVTISFVFVFFITKEKDPDISELAYTEYSASKNISGSVIPASCDSSNPFATTYNWWNPNYFSTGIGWWDTAHSGSHFPGDCTTSCPAGSNGGSYDPYYDSTASGCSKTCPNGSVISYPSACPVPTVNIHFN